MIKTILKTQFLANLFNLKIKLFKQILKYSEIKYRWIIKMSGVLESVQYIQLSYIKIKLVLNCKIKILLT